MANWLNDDEKKFVAQMKVGRQNERLIALLERQLDHVTKQLRVSPLDMVARLQGRALALSELIDAFMERK